MKKLVVLMLLASSCLFSSSIFADDLKMGVLDINKVLLESPQVAAVKAKLKKQFAPKEKQIVDQQKAIQEMVKKYEKENVTMKKTELQETQQKIIEKQKKLQKAQSDFQSELVKAQNEAMQKVLKQVESVVSDIAIAKKLDVVITKASVAYSNEKFDITDEVTKSIKNKK